MFLIACFPFILETFVSVLKSLGSKDDQVLAGLGLSFMYRQYVLGRAHLWVFFSIFSVFQVFVWPFFQRLWGVGLLWKTVACGGGIVSVTRAYGAALV